jgi:hypothetical protein
MAQLFTNGARALLTSGITSTANSLTVEAGKADLFPVANVGAGSLPSVNNWFKAVLQDSLGNIEIVYVRTRASGSGVFSNVLRGQEGTIARAYSSGSVVGLRITATDINSVIDFVSKNNAFTGSNSFAGVSEFFGAASFSQLIAGSINGNAATVTNGVYTTGSQTIGGDKTFSGLLALSSSRIVIANSSLAMYEMHLPSVAARAWYLSTDGVTRLAITNGGGTASSVLLSVNDAGNFTALGDVTAYSDERLKENWRDLPEDFLERLARVKMGVYDRIDTGETQVGVGAGSLRLEAMSHAVSEDAQGFLSVAYGNAALASCVALAREVVKLNSRIAALEK